MSKNRGSKHDNGKIRFDLFDPWFHEQIAKVLTHGAKEHGDYNWKDVESWRFEAALERHINAIRKGEYIDIDTGASHHACAVCNLMFLEYFERIKK